MKKAEGQKANFIEKHSKIIILWLAIAAIIIIAIIITLLIARYSATPATSNQSPAETSEEIQKLNEESQRTSEALSSPESQEEITGLISEYSETLSDESSSTDDKYISTLQSSRLHNYQKDYGSSISVLTQLLNSSSLADPEKYQLLAQLEYTFYLSGDEAARIETINKILDLPDETDLLSYNTDMSSVKKNYTTILNQLQTKNGGLTNE